MLSLAQFRPNGAFFDEGQTVAGKAPCPSKTAKIGRFSTEKFAG